MKTKRLIKNSAKCVHCGDVIESKSVHDMQWCSCGTIAVDGGHEYLKRSFKNSKDDFIDMSVYEDIKSEETIS